MEAYLLRFRGEYTEQIDNFLKKAGMHHIPFSHIYFGKGAFVRYAEELWSEDEGVSVFSRTKTRIVAKSREIAEQIIGALERSLNALPEKSLSVLPEKETA
jgi:hypothetical protein